MRSHPKTKKAQPATGTQKPDPHLDPESLLPQLQTLEERERGPTAAEGDGGISSSSSSSITGERERAAVSGGDRLS